MQTEIEHIFRRFSNGGGGGTPIQSQKWGWGEIPLPDLAGAPPPPIEDWMGSPWEGTWDQWKFYGMEMGVSPLPRKGMGSVDASIMGWGWGTSPLLKESVTERWWKHNLPPTLVGLFSVRIVRRGGLLS